MTPNQARLVRFHLGYPGWQAYGQQSRAAANRLADWGILERRDSASPQFRLALSDDARRALDAAPAMLAALQELVADATGAAVVARNEANARGDYAAAYVSRLTRAIEAGRAAIAAATGAPTDAGGAAAPTVAIRAGGYTLEPRSDGMGWILTNHEGPTLTRRAIFEEELAAAFGALDADPTTATGER